MKRIFHMLRSWTSKLQIIHKPIEVFKATEHLVHFGLVHIDSFIDVLFKTLHTKL